MAYPKRNQNRNKQNVSDNLTFYLVTFVYVDFSQWRSLKFNRITEGDLKYMHFYV